MWCLILSLSAAIEVCTYVLVLVCSTYHETEQSGEEVSVDSCPGQFIVSDEQMPHTLCLGNLGFCQLINNHARPGDGDDTAGKRIENDEGENLSKHCRNRSFVFIDWW